MTPIQSETQSTTDTSSPQEPPTGDPSAPSEQQAILDFWFGPPGNPDSSYAERRRMWFGKDEAVDTLIRQKFEEIYTKASSGDYKSWQSSSKGCLALAIVLDQFPRNMFRGNQKSFETDPQALKITQKALAQGFDRELLPVQRLFLYLPLEHSENRDHQQQAVTLFQALADEHQEFNDTYVYALKHQAVIERFGRFPHRNEILSRPSTPEELEFLQQPGSSF